MTGRSLIVVRSSHVVTVFSFPFDFQVLLPTVPHGTGTLTVLLPVVVSQVVVLIVDNASKIRVVSRELRLEPR